MFVCSLAFYLIMFCLYSSLEGRNHFNVKLQEDQDNMEEEVEEASYDDEEYSLEYEVSLSHDLTV